jgi:hypothetical protein
MFDAWRKLGYAPADYIRRRRIGLIFVGGYSDWDFTEFAAKRGAAPVHYIRTHASSTVISGKATGVPHYRIVQVEQRVAAGPTRITLLPEDGPYQRAQHSAPVGRLKVSFDGPNDGSAETLKVTVLNRLTLPLEKLRVMVNLKRTAAPPAAVGGTIERVIDSKDRKSRQVWLRIDCPDLGAASAVVGPESARDRMPSPPKAIRFRFLGDPVLTYRAARAADGFGYYATDGQIQLQMTNEGKEPAAIWPIVRLHGNRLWFRDQPPDKPIELAPGERKTLPVNTPLGSASPGEHWLTVYLPDDPLPFVSGGAVMLVVLSEQPAARNPTITQSPSSQPAER